MTARWLTAGAGAALASVAVWLAPRGLDTNRLGSLDAQAHVVSTNDPRWIRVWLPKPEPAETFLGRHGLTGATKVCRTRCDSVNVDCASLRGVQGELWVAFGAPAPVTGPECAEAGPPSPRPAEAGIR